MRWTAPGEASLVRATILYDGTAAKRTVHRCAPERETKRGPSVWMWWREGPRSDDDCVGASAVCKHGKQWWSCRSILPTRSTDICDGEIWAIGPAHHQTIATRETLQRHGVKVMANCSNMQCAIRLAAGLEPVPEPRVARQIGR